MTRHFSIPTVLRMTPNGILRAIFTRLGHTMHEVPWEKLPQRNIESVLESIRKLSLAEQSPLETVLHNIFDMACESGNRAIREVAAVAKMPVVLPEVGGPYCMSAWTWLNYPDVFDRAMLLFEVDNLSRWRKRKDVPRVEARTTPEALRELGVAIGDILHREEGRGQHCTVEFVHRGDGADCFLAYTDDFVHTILMHDKAAQLVPRSIRPTFDIVFAYNRVEGTMEINAKLPTRLKTNLEDLFCQIILGETAKSNGRGAVYNLNVLKDGTACLETDPEDNVTPIIRRLRMAIPESHDMITLEPDRTGGPESIYRMLEECLNREKLPLCELDVASATIGFVFHPIDGRKPGRLTFDVARPDTCTLRNHRPDRVALAQKYLKRWGIARG